MQTTDAAVFTIRRGSVSLLDGQVPALSHPGIR
jgi:hypothetical protein